jgi:hypothetical protein
MNARVLSRGRAQAYIASFDGVTRPISVRIATARQP